MDIVARRIGDIRGGLEAEWQPRDVALGRLAQSSTFGYRQPQAIKPPQRPAPTLQLISSSVAAVPIAISANEPAVALSAKPAVATAENMIRQPRIIPITSSGG